MTTATTLFPTTTVPCPSWCNAPTGHPYETEDAHGHDERYHSLSIGKVGEAYVEINAGARWFDGAEHVGRPILQVWIDSVHGGETALSVSESRELAGLLVEAADRLAGILAQETVR